MRAPIAAWTGAAAVIAALSPALVAQVSPGALSSAHARFDNPRGCLSCHGPGGRNEDLRCLDCHREIAARIERGTGLHGREALRDCGSCHPEHGGRDFRLIEWREGSARAFDHGRTGWALAGRHTQLDCRACHRREFQQPAALEGVERRDPASTWLGVATDCAGCHQDVHASALGTACASCHDASAWKPARGFDHERTAFPLTGKHRETACARCHLVPGRVEVALAGGRTAPRYRPVPHAECSACHADSHAGALGPACATCHATTSFAAVERARFDHSRTRYPLAGAHARLECRSCHDAKSAWGKKPPFATCDGCHRDPHRGAATVAGRRVDCSACHRLEGFRPSTFSVAMHAGSRFPLQGKHAAVECRRCHVPSGGSGPDALVLRPASARCADCHADAHAGQLASREDRGACESCHAVAGWKPSTFDAARHATLALPLEGPHAKAACSACHGPTRPGLPALPAAERLGAARVALASLDAACGSCHADPHGGRFAAGGATPVPGGCAACHDAASFRPSKVDAERHAALGFRLEGAHRTVPCIDCHESLGRSRSAGTLLRTSLAPLDLTRRHDRCADCHEPFHGDAFARRADGGACESCHDASDWRPAPRFDHDRETRFPLAGAHERVPCAACHPRVADASGRARTIYAPLSSRCETCHGRGADEARRQAARAPGGAG